MLYQCALHGGRHSLGFDEATGVLGKLKSWENATSKLRWNRSKGTISPSSLPFIMLQNMIIKSCIS